MHCFNCGAPLEDGANFCTKCGTNQNVTAPPAPTPAPAPAPTPAAAPKASGANPILIAGVCSVAVIVVIAILFFAGIGPFAPATNNQTANSAGSITSVPANNQAPTNNTPSNTNTNTNQNPTPAPAPALDTTQVNLFLSNYTEAGNLGQTTDNVSAWTTDQLVSWAFTHDFLNGKTRLEARSDHQSEWPVAPKSDPTKYGSWRMSLDQVRTVVQTWFKVDINPSNCKYQVYENGYFYFYVGAAIMPCGVAHATNITSMGGDRYKVEFDVYRPKDYNYQVLDQDLYSMSAEELMSTFGCSGPSGHGTAVIESGYTGTAPFKPITFSVS